jgi:hypothetical protein
MLLGMLLVDWLGLGFLLDKRQNCGAELAAKSSGIVAGGCRLGGGHFVAGVRVRPETGPGWQTGVMFMTQCLLALYREYAVPIPLELTREEAA